MHLSSRYKKAIAILEQIDHILESCNDELDAGVMTPYMVRDTTGGCIKYALQGLTQCAAYRLVGLYLPTTPQADLYSVPRVCR